MLRFIILFILMTFCQQVSGQPTKEVVCHDLPQEYKYDFRTKKFFLVDGGFGKKVDTGDSILLGCSEFAKKGLPIEFMLSIKEKRKTAMLRLRKKRPIFTDKRLSMHLYAIKRSNYQDDEKIINALDYYCYYGQENYYFLTKKYILFTYAIGGAALPRADIDSLTKVENHLVKNLNTDIASRTRIHHSYLNHFLRPLKFELPNKPGKSCNYMQNYQ